MGSPSRNRSFISTWNEYQRIASELCLELGVDVLVVRSDSMKFKFHVMGRTAGDPDEVRRLVVLIRRIRTVSGG
jgi:hypothetical protein